VAVEVGPEDFKADKLQEIPVVEANIRRESRIICHTDPDSPGADRFRFLRMRLRERRDAGKLKVLLVTSPLAHDGKSTIVSNLATALSERGKRNVLCRSRPSSCVPVGTVGRQRLGPGHGMLKDS
jgi:Mrp family chromosome partitioning ATPase